MNVIIIMLDFAWKSLILSIIYDGPQTRAKHRASKKY